MTDTEPTVTFEQPLTERVRTFLRLEFLFGQHTHHGADASEFGLRARLGALLDILFVLSRSDLKSEIQKELSDQQAALTKLSSTPGVDPARLEGVLTELRECLAALAAVPPQFAASALRSDDLLLGVQGRLGIQGGACSFDLPLLHYWLRHPDGRLVTHLDHWRKQIAPFERAITLYLRLLRKSVPAQDVTAPAGIYVYTPQTACTLVRVCVGAALFVIPEISASKHRFTVRFVSHTGINSRAHQATADIPFRLTTCNL